MAKFAAQYATADGKIENEVIEAANERAAAAQLESEGYTPIALRSQSASGRSGAKAVRTVRGGKRLRRALIDFTHQLASITESGIPMVGGLKAVRDQTENAQLRNAIGRIVNRVEGGRGLAESLDAEPETFPDIYVKTVAAGEAAAKVPEVLEAIARYMEQEAETRSQVRSALLYPMLVVVSLVAAAAFMLVFVVPQFASMFDKFGGELPLPTKILMAVSDAILNHFIWCAISIAVVVFTLRRTFRLPGPRRWLDTLYLRMPVFGKLLIGVYMTRFIELLTLLTRSALPITQALRITSDAMTVAPLKRDVRGMVRSIEGGWTLGEAVAETKWLRPLIKRMLAI